MNEGRKKEERHILVSFYMFCNSRHSVHTIFFRFLESFPSNSTSSFTQLLTDREINRKKKKKIKTL